MNDFVRRWFFNGLMLMLVLVGVGFATTYIREGSASSFPDGISLGGSNLTDLDYLAGYYVVNNVADLISKGESGGNILVECGSYLLTDDIDVLSNTKIEGVNRDCVKLTLDDNVNTPSINIESVENVTVKGLTIDHGTQSADVHNVRIVNSKNVLIEDNNIINGFHHNINGDADFLVVKNNYVANAGTGGVNGVDIIIGGQNNSAIGNYVVANDFAGIQCYSGGYNCLVSDNFVYWTGNAGGLGGIYSSSDYSIITNNFVVGNGTDSGISGIKLTADHFILSNNIIRNLNSTVGRGIWLAGADNGIVSSNVIELVYQGLYIEGVNNTISNNLLDATYSNAIWLRANSDETLISNNKVLNSGGYGVVVDVATINNIINGNYVGGSANDNYWFRGDYSVYSNNIAVNSGSDGFYLQGFNNSVVVGNIAYGNTANNFLNSSMGAGVRYGFNVE